VIRNIRLRWLRFSLAWGLACWLALSGRSIVAQQPVSTAETSKSDTTYILGRASLEDNRFELTAQTEPEPDLKSRPNSTAPIQISIGLHLSNLADINQSSETFEVTGYLMYSWRDSRLAYPSAPNAANKDSSLDKIWHPAIEMVNSKAASTSDTTVEILPDGTVMVQERFSKTLSSALELQNFPFDRQSLDIVLESLRYDDRTVKLVTDPRKISIGTDSFVSLSEWQIGKIASSDGKSFFPPEQQHYSRVTVKTHVQRNYGFYILKVMIPLLLITIASWSVFWIDPKEFSTQITIAFTNLLTVVALLLVINDKLPRVGYLTLMDGFTMICFLTILIAILVLIIAHRSIANDDPHRAQKVHELARWVGPTGFLISNLILFASMNFLNR
jgi:Neurotransmitter-gated ion-channel ligand binding domain/Neurotransmitter-gated ion-channel transmembrane region